MAHVYTPAAQCTIAAFYVNTAFAFRIGVFLGYFKDMRHEAHIDAHTAMIAGIIPLYLLGARPSDKGIRRAYRTDVSAPPPLRIKNLYQKDDNDER